MENTDKTKESIDSWLTELREQYSIRNVTLVEVMSKEQQIKNTKHDTPKSK